MDTNNIDSTIAPEVTSTDVAPAVEPTVVEPTVESTTTDTPAVPEVPTEAVGEVNS